MDVADVTTPQVLNTEIDEVEGARDPQHVIGDGAL
jgi:hypothetical protein